MTLRSLAFRRVCFLITLIAASVWSVVEFRQLNATHPHLVYLTGWGLLGLMLILTAFNARKKLPFLPLISARIWLQVHLYLGLFTALLFLLHLRWHWPQGGFEITLALLFLAVTFSGIFGWWLSRALPKRMTSAGGEVPFERIPVVRRSLQLQAEKLVLAGIGPAKASTLADFYVSRLSGFFSGPANLGSHLFGSQRPLNTLLGQIAEVDRFITPSERQSVAELSELVRQKNMLDFHRSTQLALKGWLFVHIPLTYGLLVFSVAHVVIIYAFSGGAR